MAKNGIIPGDKPHFKGGIDVIVKDTNQLIEVESKEYQICKSAMDSKEILYFTNKTNIEILDSIHKKYNCPAFDKTAQSGDFIVCKIAVADDKPRRRVMGTASQIVNGINGLAGGKVDGETAEVVMEKGGKIKDVTCSNCGWSWNKEDSDKEDEYVCHKCGCDNKMEKGGKLIKRADGSYSKHGLWDSLRENAGSGKKPTKQMLEQEAKIKANTMEDGGTTTDQDNKETYEKWKSLVNMSKAELKEFYDSKEGKEAGLSNKESNELGINNGRESARMIMKMKDTTVSDWTLNMWKWANKQISFISRMSGNKGSLYDDNGNKTRKHTSLLIWGHNPEKYESGGSIEPKESIYELTLYKVQVGGDSHTEFKYTGTDLEEAEREYNYADIDDLSSSDKYIGGVVILEKQTNKYEFIYDLYEDESVEDYPIEDYYEDDSIYELIEEGDYEEIETRGIIGENDIKEQNEEQADELLNETINYFKKLYNRYTKAGYVNRESYYFLIPIPNTDNTIELRLSNHSPNFDNIDSNKNEVIKTELVRFGENPKEIDVSDPDFYDQVYDNDMGFIKYRQIKPKNRVALINCVIYHTSDETYSKFDKNTEYNVINEYFDLNKRDYELSDITETIENIIQEQIDEYDGNQTIFKKGGKISKELKKGIKVESEHKDTAKKIYNHEITPDQAPTEIAKDHIDENPNYYDDLEQSGIVFEDGGNVGNLTHEQIEANIINQQFGYIL